jgi:anti-sigma-K factor RskA
MNDSDHKRWSEGLAAYLLGALDADEAAELERHLEGCERCREELRRLEPAVQVLPDSVERREPPRRLRDNLMAEVRDDVRPAPVKRARWGFRLATGFAVLALGAAVVAGYEIGRDAPGEREARTTFSRQPGGVAVKMVRQGDGGTLHFTHLHQLPPGKVLEAWVQREGEVEAVPALFVPDRHGRAEAMIADMEGVEEVMVTEEPRGGSEEPTSKPIVVMSVPQ